MSTPALARALQDPATLRHLASTAMSAAATDEERSGALALLELAVEAGTATAPPAVATPAPTPPATMPIPPVVTHLHQVLPASTLSALSSWDHAQRAAGEAAEAERDRLWDEWEAAHFAAGSRPSEAASAATPPDDDYWAWLHPEAPDPS